MKRLKTLCLLFTGLMAAPPILFAQEDIALDTFNSSEVTRGYPVSTYGEKIKLPFLTHPAFVGLSPKGEYKGPLH